MADRSERERVTSEPESVIATGPDEAVSTQEWSSWPGSDEKPSRSVSETLLLKDAGAKFQSPATDWTRANLNPLLLRLLHAARERLPRVRDTHSRSTTWSDQKLAID